MTYEERIKAIAKAVRMIGATVSTGGGREMHHVIADFSTGAPDLILWHGPNCTPEEIETEIETEEHAHEIGEMLAYHQATAADRACLAALEQPTEAMIVDGFEAMAVKDGNWQTCREAASDATRSWRAMLAAAPKGPHA